MFYIARQTFPDRLLNAADLSAAADLWRQWYLLSKPMGQRGTVQLSARIDGLSRRDIASTQAQLSGSTLSDPDTLELQGSTTPADAGIDASAWDRAMAVAAGRPVAMRLYAAVVGTSSLAPNEPGSTSTLLLVGRPRTDGFLLKAAMRLGSIGNDEEMYRRTAWPLEAKFLAAFDPFRTSGDAKAAFTSFGDDGKPLFATRDVERKVRRMTRMIVEVPGEHSPLSLVKRMAVPLGMAGSARFLWAQKPDLWPAAAAAGGLALLMAGRVVYTKAQRITKFHRSMNTGLAKVYAKAPTFAKADLAEAGLADDPSAAKYTADILALGAVHCYDFQITSLDATRGTTRLFHLPADRTFVSVLLLSRAQNLQFFPAMPVVSAKTYFDGGATVATQASKHAYRKPVDPNSHGRCLPEDTDPATLLARHRDLLRTFAPRGQQPLAADPDNVFSLETAEHNRLHDLHKARGCFYTWSDALHQGFDVPRRELVK